jgi:hypothetical protein
MIKKTNKASTITLKDYAKHRRVSQSTVSRWKAKKLLVLKSGRVDVQASDAILDRLEMKFDEGADPKNHTEALFMKEMYLAKLRRLEFLQKSGELIELEAVKSTLADIFRQHRDALLTIPERMSASLAFETDPGKVHTLISAEIRTHLEGLADALENK